MSGAATGPSLSNERRFPNFFRTITSDNDFILAQNALLRELNYNTVLATHQKDSFFIDFMSDTMRHLRANGRHVMRNDAFEAANDASLASRQGLRVSKAMSDTVDELKKARDIPVILSVFGNDAGRRLICEAYRKADITSRSHVWLVTAPVAMNWWIAKEGWRRILNLLLF